MFDGGPFGQVPQPLHLLYKRRLIELPGLRIDKVQVAQATEFDVPVLDERQPAQPSQQKGAIQKCLLYADALRLKRGDFGAVAVLGQHFRKRRAAQKDTFQVTRIGCDEVWGWQREGPLAVAVVIDQSDRAVDCQPIEID